MNTQEIEKINDLIKRSVLSEEFVSAVEYHFHEETVTVNMDGSIDIYLHSTDIDNIAIFTGHIVLNTYQSGKCNIMLHLTGLKIMS